MQPSTFGSRVRRSLSNCAQLFDWNGGLSIKPVENFTVLFGVKNILNTNPPFSNANQNNFAAGHNSIAADPLLRNYYFNVS